MTATDGLYDNDGHNYLELPIPNFPYTYDVDNSGLGGAPYDNAVHDLKIGLITPIYETSWCPHGAVGMVARAAHDINTGNATFCPAIANLRHSAGTLGNVNGFKVGVTTLDGFGIPNAFNAGMKLMGKAQWNGALLDSMTGVIAGCFSSYTKAIAAMFQSYNIPQLDWGATEATLSNKVDYPNFWRVYFDFDFLNGAVSGVNIYSKWSLWRSVWVSIL